MLGLLGIEEREGLGDGVRRGGIVSLEGRAERRPEYIYMYVSPEGGSVVSAVGGVLDAWLGLGLGLVVVILGIYLFTLTVLIAKD